MLLVGFSMDQQAIIVRMTRKIIQLMELEPQMADVVFLSTSGKTIKLMNPKFYDHFMANTKALSNAYVIALLKRSIISDDQIDFNILFVALMMCKDLMHDQEGLVDNEEPTLKNNVRILIFAILPYAKNLDSIILQI